MILDIVMRFLHIASAVTLVGGAIAWSLALAAESTLAAEVKAKVGNAAAAAIRPVFLAAIAGALISGVYQYLDKSKGAQPAWHAVIGVKFLLVLHIFAVGFIATKSDNDRRARQLKGIVFSGLATILLAAVLRYLSTPVL